jgi:deoxyguanosine kinase
MKKEQLRFVAVEGPIGAGKTSLAKMLASWLGADTLFEAPGDNAFLPRFYQDQPRWALATQLSYLFQRADQLQTLATRAHRAPPVVADFLLDKDPLFARLTLLPEEYELYVRTYRTLQLATPRPDLVVVLQTSVDTLMARVKRRGVRFEQSVTPTYLAKLADAYSGYFHTYRAAPVLVVDSTHLNYVENPSHFAHLANRIETMNSSHEYFKFSDV